MKTSKTGIITTVLGTALGLMTGCAHTGTRAEAITAHGVRAFQCAPTLDARSCHLVRSAAYWATQHGYVTIEGPGGYVFVPGENRTVFFNGAPSQTLNHVTLVSPDLLPGKVAAIERHGPEVVCNFLPGGVQVSDGELVGTIANIFSEGR